MADAGGGTSAALEPIELEQRSSGFWRYFAAALLAMVGTGGLLFLWALRASRTMSAEETANVVAFWTIMQGMAALAGACALTGGAAFALLQYSRSKHERHLTLYNDIFSQLMSPAQVDARRTVYDLFRFTPGTPKERIAEILVNLTEAQRAHIKTCLNSLDYLGFLVCQGWLDDNKTLGWLSPIVVKTWDCLKPVVLFEREERGDAGYYRHCDFLAERCKDLDKAGRRRTLPAHAARHTVKRL